MFSSPFASSRPHKVGGKATVEIPLGFGSEVEVVTDNFDAVAARCTSLILVKMAVLVFSITLRGPL